MRKKFDKKYLPVGREVFVSLLFCFAFFLPACSSNTQVKISNNDGFPRPLVQQLPIAMGIHIPEGFSSYIFREQEEEQKSPTVTIDLGAAQTDMLQSVLPGLYEKSVFLLSLDSSVLQQDLEQHSLDFYLVPSVNKLQYSTPKITRVNVFEVWVKYQFDVYDPSGHLLVKWLVPAYGKTPTAFIKSKKVALNLATLAALRDGGAAFVTGFGKLPEIKQWLENRQAATSKRKVHTPKSSMSPLSMPRSKE